MNRNLKYLYTLILQNGWEINDQAVTSSGTVWAQLTCLGYAGERLIKLTPVV